MKYFKNLHEKITHIKSFARNTVLRKTEVAGLALAVRRVYILSPTPIGHAAIAWF